jgi:hypothetical protein
LPFLRVSQILQATFVSLYCFARRNNFNACNVFIPCGDDAPEEAPDEAL